VAPKVLIFQKFGVLPFVDFSTRKETELLLVSDNTGAGRFRQHYRVTENLSGEEESFGFGKSYLSEPISNP
jgi:hypothetical protein